MSPANGLQLLEPASAKEWHAWLRENHHSSAGVWLAVGKKGGRRTKLTYELAVEEALCWGWIDSTANRLDDDRYKQLFTPRKPHSTWSKSNKERVERLIAAGRMRPAGLAAIEAAKSNGAWTSLDDIDALVVPDDLASALAEVPAAASYFASLSDSPRKLILYWIATAKRSETRAKRVAATVTAAAQGRPPF